MIYLTQNELDQLKAKLSPAMTGVSPITVSQTPNGYVVRMTDSWFYGMITDLYAESEKPLAYAWKEVMATGKGTWKDTPNGRVGTVNPNANEAYELNSVMVSTGTVVRMWKGISSEYLFDVSGGLVLRVDSLTLVDGHYPAFVQIYEAGIWADVGDVVYLDEANGSPLALARYLATRMDQTSDDPPIPIYVTATPQIGCGLKQDVDSGLIELDPSSFAGPGLSNIPSTCIITPVLGCGISLIDGAITWDAAGVVGPGMSNIVSTCMITPVLGCGVSMVDDAITFDAEAAAGSYLSGTGCTLDVNLPSLVSTIATSNVYISNIAVGVLSLVAVNAGCAISVTGLTVGVNPLAIKAPSNSGLTASTSCGSLAINCGDGLRITPVTDKLTLNTGGCNSVSTDVFGHVVVVPSALAGLGLSYTGCQLIVEPGCGITTIDGPTSVFAPDLAGDYLSIGTGCTLNVNLASLVPSLVPSLVVPIISLVVPSIVNPGGGIGFNPSTYQISIIPGQGINIVSDTVAARISSGLSFTPAGYIQAATASGIKLAGQYIALDLVGISTISLTEGPTTFSLNTVGVTSAISIVTGVSCISGVLSITGLTGHFYNGVLLSTT